MTVHRVGGETAEVAAFCAGLPGPACVAGPTGYGLARVWRWRTSGVWWRHGEDRAHGVGGIDAPELPGGTLETPIAQLVLDVASAEAVAR
jgi:hypothetical protein